MSANANVVDPVKGTSTLVRPRFSPGLLLRDDDLRVGVDYTRELSRLLFRSLFGCGVVCGLEVEARIVCGKLKITVNPGVALDCEGDPIHVPRPAEIIIDPTCGKEIPDEIWVILCRTDKCCAPRSTACGCDEDDSASVCTREHDGFEIRIVRETRNSCACACERIDLPTNPDRTPEEETSCWCADPCGCHKDHYAGKCSCDCCEGDCVVLSVLNKVQGKNDGQEQDDLQWTVNHSVRRFVRPVLMRDPVVHKEQYPGDPLCGTNEPVMAEDRLRHGDAQAQAADADVADRAAKTAASAAMTSLRKSAEVRKALAAGRLEVAEAAAKVMDAKALEAEVAARVLTEKAFAAAVSTRQELKAVVARNEAAERDAAATLAARAAAADKVAEEKVAAEKAAVETVAAEPAAVEAASPTTPGPENAGLAATSAKKSRAKKNANIPPDAQ